MNSDYAEILSPNLYYDRYFDIDSVKIQPGEYYVTTRDMALVTVLGSCVAACIRDRKSGIGGMNHFLLPDSQSEAESPVKASMRYGAYAMEMMINQLLKLGASRTMLEAKVFGGGNVLSNFTSVNVGQRNAEFVLGYLQAESISLVAQDMLDVYSRKIYFFPRSGKVMMKKLHNLHNDTVVEREQEYVARLKISAMQGDVELF